MFSPPPHGKGGGRAGEGVVSLIASPTDVNARPTGFAHIHAAAGLMS
jgi:hypothetical protein